MATKTLRQLLVSTLSNIGEPVLAANVPAVGSPITDVYMLQLCNFINHIKEEVEQSWHWSSRWQTYTMTYVSGNVSQQIYDIGGFFLPAGASPNSGAQVVRIMNPKFGREVALVFDITTFGIPFVLDEMPLPDMKYYNTVLNQTPVAYSTNFTVQDYGNDQVYLNMYPGANSNRSIQITLYNPQVYVDPTNGTGNQTDLWNTGTLPISFNAPPLLGAVAGTLSIPFQYTSGTYPTTFTGPNSGGTGVTTQIINVTYVNGSAATTFGAAILNNAVIPTVIITGLLSGGVGCDSPILLPNSPIELGAAWWALQERGETLGANSMFSEQRFRTTLDDYIGRDKGMQGDIIMIPC